MGGKRVLTATLASLLLPGLGQALLGAWVAAALLISATLLLLLAVVLHLSIGLAVFESSLGAFLFRVLLRTLVMLDAFAVIDAYGRSDPDDGTERRRRRLATGLNLMIPGTGYLVARAWLRAATGLALLVLLLYFARRGGMPYLDVLFVGMQVVMAGLVYLQLRVAAERAAQEKGLLPPPPHPPLAPAAQIVCLVVAVAAIIGCAIIVEKGIPPSALRGLSSDDVRTRSTESGIRVEIARLGLSLSADGPGWTRTESPKFLFQAENRAGGQLMLGLQQVHPFERGDRMQQRLRRWLESTGLVHRQTKLVDLNGVAADQMRFTGDFPDGHRVDHWTIAVPRPGFAFLLMLQCERARCPEVAPLLEKSRDTFLLARH